jgi:AraC-like DNA-binding protein
LSVEGFKHLHGKCDDVGFSIAFGEISSPAAVDLRRVFHPRCVGVWLNLEGAGLVQTGAGDLMLGQRQAGFFATGDRVVRALTEAGQHRFILLQFTHLFLIRHLASCDGSLHPVIEGFLRNPRQASVGATHRLTTHEQRLAEQLIQPGVPAAARGLWYQSKSLELMAHLFFERPVHDEMFCDRQKRVARERVERVIAILRQDLCTPPGLHEIGRQAGCSPFHLSRTFSKEMRMTIPQYLRKLRMERAAGLLQSGQFNVTEAALEVGYSSLSHFSLAFCQTMGQCPGLYALKLVRG